MKSMAVINFYFADQKPKYLDFYLSSCSYNPTVDFILFTNLDIQNNYPNIKVVNIKFEEFTDILINKITSGLLEHGIKEKIVINQAYKISDFRPCFGYCLEEYLKEYDFWGVSDLDLIFGNIRKYIPGECLEKYNKLYENGHFFLIKNTKECNEMFFEDYENSFYSAIHSEKNSFYEEVYEKPWIPSGGINSRFDERGQLYKNRKTLCDISFKYHNLIDFKNQVDSKRIVFVFDKGTLYRVYKTKNEIHKEEVFYAHFQKRSLMDKTDNVDEFYITNTAFRSIPEDDEELFTDTKQFDYITYRWFKFRYIDALKRKLNGNFKKRELK